MAEQTTIEQKGMFMNTLCGADCVNCGYGTKITSIVGETTMAEDILLTKTSTATNPTA